MGRPLRVLVVDDSPDTRVTLKMVLDLWGHEAEIADPDHAPQLVEAIRPDVVISSLGKSNLGGELARRIRGDRTDRPYLIALSGYHDHRRQDEAREAGFDEVLVKPPDFDHLKLSLDACRPVAAD